MVCQKAAPIWLPFAGINHRIFTVMGNDWYVRIGRLGGESAGKKLVSIIAVFTKPHRRGARMLFQHLVDGDWHARSRASWLLGPADCDLRFGKVG
jgi:hypothetical protein